MVTIPLRRLRYSSPAPVTLIFSRKNEGAKSMSRRKQQKKFKVTDLPEHLQQVNLNAAGIDVGSDRHVVAVPSGRDEVSVREFGAFTTDLHALADWLTKCGITTVAMESTGVYWIPLFEILEQRGFEVKLVDARQVKNVSGRKSDVLDCQWLQQLHTYGLLRGAFRPEAAVRRLRALSRHRADLVTEGGSHLQQAQKALVQMNVQLPLVVSDINGETGLRIIDAILEGEHN